MKAIKCISSILMIIGSLNWGLVGLFNFDLVDVLFGTCCPMLVKVVYVAVGLAGVYGIVMMAKCCKNKH